MGRPSGPRRFPGARGCREDRPTPAGSVARPGHASSRLAAQTPTSALLWRFQQWRGAHVAFQAQGIGLPFLQLLDVSRGSFRRTNDVTHAPETEAECCSSVFQVPPEALRQRPTWGPLGPFGPSGFPGAGPNESKHTHTGREQGGGSLSWGDGLSLFKPSLGEYLLGLCPVPPTITGGLWEKREKQSHRAARKACSDKGKPRAGKAGELARGQCVRHGSAPRPPTSGSLS